MTMTWEQKFMALKALAEMSLEMRSPGDWFVPSGGVEVTSDNSATLTGKYGNGPTPQLAVEDHWKQLTELKPGEYLVLHAMLPTRSHHRWNGYMWESLPVQKRGNK